jgi:GNAT superfamily N-acetyltransferase
VLILAGLRVVDGCGSWEARTVRRNDREETTLADDAKIRRLGAAEMDERIAALSHVLMDCVEGGASVSFMTPLTRERADAFWLGIKDRIAAGTTELLIAELDGHLAGTVQLVMAQPENQPHRADVAKMLVHRRARRRGLGRALMNAAEDLARAKGKTLLVLDTASEEADRLYKALNWTVVGRVPGYALFPDGRPCDTTFFYKRLAPLSADEGRNWKSG